MSAPFNIPRDRASVTPSALNSSIADSFRVDAGNLRPLRDSMSPAFISDPAVSPHIRRLYVSCCPTHVPLRIVTIIVNTIQSMISGRTRADVIQKVFERVKQNLNAATAVISVRGIVGIPTSILRGVIHIILRAMAQFVCGQSRYEKIFRQTSTRACVVPSQICTSHDSFVAAVTKAMPILGSPGIRTRVGGYDQTVEPFASHINKSVVGWFRRKGSAKVRFGHKFLLNRNLCLGLGENLWFSFKPFLILSQSLGLER